MLLYIDFVLSSFPYLHMNSIKFALAISEHMPGWAIHDCFDLFRYTNNTFICIYIDFEVNSVPCLGLPIYLTGGRWPFMIISWFLQFAMLAHHTSVGLPSCDVDIFFGNDKNIIYLINAHGLTTFWRFFDREKKNYLTLDEFKNLLQNIRKVRKGLADEWTIEEEAEHYMKWRTIFSKLK